MPFHFSGLTVAPVFVVSRLERQSQLSREGGHQGAQGHETKLPYCHKETVRRVSFLEVPNILMTWVNRPDDAQDLGHPPPALALRLVVLMWQFGNTYIYSKLN